MIKLGQRLKEERVKRNLSFDDVTKATKIRQSFIIAIERGEYHILPSSSYAQGFVVNYAEYLGFSKREALALFRREYDESKVLSVLPERFADPAESSFPRIKIHQTVFGILLAFIFLLSYLLFSYRDVFLNPPLTVSGPKQAITTSSEVVVTGKTSPYATVTINNAVVSLDTDGSFRKLISLFPGDVTITIKSRNRFGRETIVVRNVTVRNE